MAGRKTEHTGLDHIKHAMAELDHNECFAKFPDRFKALITAAYTTLIDEVEAEKRKKISEIQEFEKSLRLRWSVHVREKIRAVRSLEAEVRHSTNMKMELKDVTAKAWKDQEKITDLIARLVKAESENKHSLENIENLKKRCENLKKKWSTLKLKLYNKETRILKCIRRESQNLSKT